MIPMVDIKFAKHFAILDSLIKSSVIDLCSCTFSMISFASNSSMRFFSGSTDW